MDDDLNTPDALAAVFDLVKDINTLSAASSKAALEAGAAAFDEITGVLGLMYNRKKDEVPAEVTELVEKRAAAKKAKEKEKALKRQKRVDKVNHYRAINGKPPIGMDGKPKDAGKKKKK